MNEGTCPCMPVRELQHQVETIKEKINEDRQEIARMGQQLLSIADKVECMSGKLDRVNDKLDKLSQKGSARWEDAVKTATSVLITLLLSYLALRLGVGG